MDLTYDQWLALQQADALEIMMLDYADEEPVGQDVEQER